MTTGKIANLAVDTLQIAGNAVTTPRTQYTSNEVSFDVSSGELVINTLSVNHKGGSVLINFGFESIEATPNSDLIMRIRRNGDLLKTHTFFVERYPNGVEEYEQQRGDTSYYAYRQVYSYRLVYRFGCIPAFSDDEATIGVNTYTVTLQKSESGIAKIKSRSLFIMGVSR